MNIYFDGFSNWGDVSSNFTGGWDEKASKAIPEPEEVLLAAYAQEAYEGDAFVIYRDGDKYFVVEGGHCSCYGLENQWKPEEYSLPLLYAALEKRGEYGAFQPFKQEIMRELATRIAAELSHQSEGGAS